MRAAILGREVFPQFWEGRYFRNFGKGGISAILGREVFVGYLWFVVSDG
jgi:hypothetical protein